MSVWELERQRLGLGRLQRRWAFNRKLLTATIVIAGAFSVWRTISPPRVVVERVPATVSLDRPAELYAQQFARAFLTADPAVPERHASALAVFDGGSGVLTRGDQDGARRRTITWTAIAQAFTVPQGTRYVVMAETAPGGPAYLAVTVRRTQEGALQIAGSPAIVGPPVSTGAADDPRGRDVSDQTVLRVVARSLRNYLAGAADDLSADLSPQAVISLPTHSLGLSRVAQTRWEDGAFQSVLATVEVRSGGGEQRQLTYELALEQRQDRWLVAAIHNNPTGR